MGFRIFIDLFQDIAGQSDVDANRFWLSVLHGNQNGHARPVVRIGHDLFQSRRLGDRFSVLHHAFDVKRKGFLGHGAGVIQGSACGDNAGKVGKRHAKMAVGVLMDENIDIVRIALTSASDPIVSRMLFQRPDRGFPFEGGNGDAALLCRVL